MTQNTTTLTKPIKTDAAFALDGKVPSDFKRVQTPATRVFGLTLWLFVIGFGFCGAMVYYAATAQMQSAVVASGSFELEGDLQVVDHLEGGLLREIHIREGDFVEKGQLLARLDGTRARAQLGVLRSQLAGALSRQARLEAAGAGADQIDFPQELFDLISWDPALEKVKQTQADLFASNRQSDQGEFQIFSERLVQLRTREVGLGDEITALNQRLEIIEEEVEGLKQLFAKGLVSKARLNARQEDAMELQTLIGRRKAERQDTLDQMAEIEERQLQIARDRRATIAEEQQLLTESIFDLRQRIRSFEDIQDRLTIHAPISGHIVGFEANTIGSVVQPGEVLMQIVPSEAPFVVEAQVATSDIDEVAVGRDARVRLSAYSFRKTPPVDGKVTYVSADSFYDQSEGVSYYRIHVELDSAALANLPDNVEPYAGMPVQVMVATGEQTVLTYLLDPVLGGLETAMVENE